MYQVIQYIKFLLKSTNQHGVHSPFVYNLVTTCFYDTSKHNSYNLISNYKASLLKNKTKIKVTDLGAGSQKMKTQERDIANIAKNAGTTNKRAKLIYRITNYFKPQNILELGTSLGITTHAMHLGNPKANITSVEGCPETALFSKQQLNKFKAENIALVNGNFKTEIEKLNSKQYDLIFFDGNHQKEATLQYFEALLESTTNDSVFIFDDIYWSEGMTEAWEIIKNHPKVTVTIDTFFWGFVFFRKEQVKEHFTIRI
ncbi:class I SAM-dependent methyltransferase [Algibacter sp. AS12]|uniref:O-methyltransferase n=1 Tax=Algibacter sp. AS12 TaxID=3135773 RepID=UPI00398A6F62